MCFMIQRTKIKNVILHMRFNAIFEVKDISAISPIFL